MADNFQTNPGSGGATFAADDVAGVMYPRVKLSFGDDGAASDVASATPLPVTGTVALDSASLTALENVNAAVTGTFWQATQPVSGPLTDAQLRATALPTTIATAATHYQPGYDLSEGVGAPGTLLTDPDGNLVARAQVLTDEGSYRVNFANSSLAVAVGTATFTNGSDTVTGSGFLAADVRSGDYIKLNADAETAWVQVDSLNSDTNLTLIANYTGTGGTGACSRAIVKPSTGSGGAIAVASGVCTIASGTTTGAITEIERDVDWLPLVKQAGVTVSQRIANQATYIGFYDETTPTAPKWFAWFVLDGTVNTTVKCQSARNPTSAPVTAEIEETSVTLPNGGTSAIAQRYRVEVLGEKCCFYVNGVLVATHFKSMPGPGDLLTSTVRIVNGTAPASTTTVTVDYDLCKNHNKLEVGILSDSEQFVAMAVPLAPYNYTFTGVIAINTDLIVLDCLQLRSLFIQCTAMGTSGVVTVQWANDAAFTAPITATLLSEAGATSTTFNAAVLRVTNVMARYCRLRLTVAASALTTTINVWGAQTAYTPIVTTQPVSGTVTATANVTGYPTAAASADALANPTVTKVDSTGLVFNGTSWDRVRGMSTALTTGDTGAKVATGNGATITNVGNKGVQILVNMGVVSGTTPTAVFKVQGSTDAGTTWYDVPGATTASIVATGQYGITIYPGIATTAGVATTGTTATASMVIPRTWRMVWTIGGTTPSFTITAIQYIYLPN